MFTAVFCFLYYYYILFQLFALSIADAQKFEPYQLTGGLVSAVAGKDYVVVASDTRMIGSNGYDIYSRRHVQSRLWGIGTDIDCSSSMIPDEPDNDNDDNSNYSEFFGPDGSIQLPIHTHLHFKNISKTKLQRSPIIIGSAGCSADCEHLKRILRSDIRAAEYYKAGAAATSYGGSSYSLSVEHVANVLSQMLYLRRGFPYYSLCVVGGFTQHGESAAYVYDGLGSYERVAVAAAGTGRELLQPILDRKFQTFPPQSDIAVDDDSNILLATGQDDNRKTIKRKQWNIRDDVAVGSSVGSLHVGCNVDQAVSILIHAYRSVSEREIGVGDLIVLCVTERNARNGDVTCRVLAVPMKEH